MLDPIDLSFVACLTDKGQTIGFYEDGRARIVLETDIRQLRPILRLIAYGRQTPIVFNAHIENPSDPKR